MMDLLRSWLFSAVGVASGRGAAQPLNCPGLFYYTAELL